MRNWKRQWKVSFELLSQALEVHWLDSRNSDNSLLLEQCPHPLHQRHRQLMDRTWDHDKEGEGLLLQLQ
jgi:hypothetical protein